jgi:hypothetical protein
MMFPSFHASHAMLANADLLPSTIDGGADGWGGLIALFLLVLAILFAMYIAAREEWQVAQGSNFQPSARSPQSPSLNRTTSA